MGASRHFKQVAVALCARLLLVVRCTANVSAPNLGQCGVSPGGIIGLGAKMFRVEGRKLSVFSYYDDFCRAPNSFVGPVRF